MQAYGAGPIPAELDDPHPGQRTGGPARPGRRSVGGRHRPRMPQATCTDRFDRPIQKPSMAVVAGSSGASAVPRVTNSGE